MIGNLPILAQMDLPPGPGGIVVLVLFLGAPALVVALELGSFVCAARLLNGRSKSLGSESLGGLSAALLAYLINRAEFMRFFWESSLTILSLSLLLANLGGFAWRKSRKPRIGELSP